MISSTSVSGLGHVKKPRPSWPVRTPSAMAAATIEDRYGLRLSTESAGAAAYRDGVDLMLSAWPGAGDAFDRAIAADPDFALAHIARARVHSFYQQSEAARKEAAIAREKVAQR